VRRVALWLDITVKGLLIGLLVFAVARPDLPQFEGKAMVGARASLSDLRADRAACASSVGSPPGLRSASVR
jgi:hypothetical protein